jgi:hypothetical protein
VLNGGVFGLNSLRSEAATVLPKNVSTNTDWIPEPLTLPRNDVEAKVEDYLAPYTNTNGETFTNVLKVHATYADSSTDGTYHELCDARVYFAKGVGLVGIDNVNYDYLKFSRYGGRYHFYDHHTYTGSAARKSK